MTTGPMGSSLKSIALNVEKCELVQYYSNQQHVYTTIQIEEGCQGPMGPSINNITINECGDIDGYYTNDTVVRFGKINITNNSSTGITGPQGPIGSNVYSGTGFYPISNDIDTTLAINDLRIPQTYYPVYFGNDITSSNDTAVIISNTHYNSNIANYSIFIGDTSDGQQNNSIAINRRNISQGTSAISLGENSGMNTQNQNAIAIGLNAGCIFQNENGIAIGLNAAQENQDNNSIAIGRYSGTSFQGNNSIALGNSAGSYSQGNNSIAIGNMSGSQKQNVYSIALGDNSNCGGDSVISIGNAAGKESTLNQKCINIGETTGYTSQESGCIALGSLAGYSSQQTQSIAIGKLAGNISQGNGSVAIGYQSGHLFQNGECIAIGNQAGFIGQSQNSIVIGYQSGYTGQQNDCIAIGTLSGNTNQKSQSISIGSHSGTNSLGNTSIVLGANSSTDSEYNIILGSNVIVNGMTGVLNTIPNINHLVGGTPLVYDTINGQIGPSVSSKRFKENIKLLSDEYTSNLSKLHVKRFNENSIGLIAEEVKKYYPEIVNIDKDGRAYSINYSLLNVLLLKKIISVC